MKYILAFLSILLIISLNSCEKEPTFQSENQIQLRNKSNLPSLKEFKNSFDGNSLNNIIIGKFDVLWEESNSECYNENLSLYMYEVPINVARLLPDNKYNISYSLALTQIEDELRFFVLKYFIENDKKKKSISLNKLRDMDGIVHLLDTGGNIQYAAIIKNGKIIKNKKTLPSPNELILENCVTVTTHHYKDWYNKNTGEYLGSSYLGSTSEEHCYRSYYPDIQNGGLNGGGGFYNPYSGAQPYEDCPLDCVHDLETEELDFDIDNEDEDINLCEIALAIQYPTCAIKINENMQVALSMTHSMFGYNGEDDCSDAFRHAYFNAINARDCGTYLAKEFGEAHECFETNQQAVVMDLFNNEVGHSIATYYNTLSEAQLGNVVMNHLQNGELQYIKNGSLVWSSDCFD